MTKGRHQAPVGSNIIAKTRHSDLRGRHLLHAQVQGNLLHADLTSTSRNDKCVYMATARCCASRFYAVKCRARPRNVMLMLLNPITPSRENALQASAAASTSFRKSISLSSTETGRQGVHHKHGCCARRTNWRRRLSSISAASSIS